MDKLPVIAPAQGDRPLVPVYRGEIGGTPTPVVNARDLHSYLENKAAFANWIKHRIDKYGFVKNQDFVVFDSPVKNSKGGRPATDYLLSLDMAKELSMVENNDKGREARRYFIAMERKALAHSGQLTPAATLAPEIAHHIDTTATRLAVEFRAKCVAHLTRLAEGECHNLSPQELIERMESWAGMRTPIVLLRDDVAFVRILLKELLTNAKTLSDKLSQEVI